jgi:hypothetical protein
MNPVLNMKRRIGLGLCWIPGIGILLSALELFGNREIADEDRALMWTILLTHAAAYVLLCVFFLGIVVMALCLVYAILTLCGKNVPEVPGLSKLGKKLAELTKPGNDYAQ